MGFKVRPGFQSQLHSEGAKGRKGKRRPAWALSSVARPEEAGTWQPQGGPLESWWAAVDCSSSEGRTSFPGPAVIPNSHQTQALTCKNKDVH